MTRSVPLLHYFEYRYNNNTGIINITAAMQKHSLCHHLRKQSKPTIPSYKTGKIGAVPSSEQIQHGVQIYFLTDRKLIFRFGHVVKQELQNHCTSQTAPFKLKVAET